jgi:hypothetical protein
VLKQFELMPLRLLMLVLAVAVAVNAFAAAVDSPVLLPFGSGRVKANAFVVRVCH